MILAKIGNCAQSFLWASSLPVRISIEVQQAGSLLATQARCLCY
jgi:hypothetical protein